MRLKIKVWHAVIALSSLLFISCFTQVINSLLLLVNFIAYLFSSNNTAAAQFNLQLADNLVSSLLFILLPAAALIFRKKWLFTISLPAEAFVILPLIYIFVFAPLITSTNPDFQKDLRVTKHLPPLSSVTCIYLKSKPADTNGFFAAREKAIKKSFDNTIIFADSIKTGDSLFYYQGESVFALDRGTLKLSSNGLPETGKKYFILGTDEYGRDVLVRLIYGARISLFIGIGAVCITFLLGIFLGFTAGYKGGFIDGLLNRISDMLLAFPAIFFIILILALFGNSLLMVIFVLGYSGWMSLFKIVRSEVVSVKQKEYFISARLSGLPWKQLLFKEIFPVIFAPVLVNLVFQYGNVILAESALSYLGLGTGSFYPSWGSMIESGQEYMSDAWWMMVFPGLALLITLFTINSLGKKLNIYFNPRLTHDK